MTADCWMIVFFGFFCISFIQIFRRDTFFGYAYGLLYVYTVFTQWGYTFRPEYSARIKAYFGAEVFSEYLKFVFLAFIAFWLLCISLLPFLRRLTWFRIQQCDFQFRRIGFLFLTLMHWGFVGLYLYLHPTLSYITVADDGFIDNLGVLFRLFGACFKLMVPSLLIWYFLLRSKKMSKGWLRWSLYSIGVAYFTVMATRLGNRTDVFALFLGLSCYEIAQARMRRKFVKCLVILAVVVPLWVLIMAQIVKLRSSETDAPRGLEEKIVVNDYFAPSHILLAAISYEYVNPRVVVASNLNNILVKQDYPYLQAFVMDLFAPGLATRSSSYAFYILGEGYIVMGPSGWIYSAIVFFLGIYLWRSFSLSDNREFNFLLLMVAASYLANAVRGQSSYFIKNIYMYFIPSLGMVVCATGMLPIPTLRASMAKIARIF